MTHKENINAEEPSHITIKIAVSEGTKESVTTPFRKVLIHVEKDMEELTSIATEEATECPLPRTHHMYSHTRSSSLW